jgi:hypothetical protein
MKASLFSLLVLSTLVFNMLQAQNSESSVTTSIKQTDSAPLSTSPEKWYLDAGGGYFPANNADSWAGQIGAGYRLSSRCWRSLLGQNQHLRTVNYGHGHTISAHFVGQFYRKNRRWLCPKSGFRQFRRGQKHDLYCPVLYPTLLQMRPSLAYSTFFDIGYLCLSNR